MKRRMAAVGGAKPTWRAMAENGVPDPKADIASCRIGLSAPHIQPTVTQLIQLSSVRSNSSDGMIAIACLLFWRYDFILFAGRGRNTAAEIGAAQKRRDWHFAALRVEPVMSVIEG